MKKLLHVTIILSVLLSDNLLASTSLEENYLLSTPVSKLDWGIFRLMQKFNNYRINNKDNPQVFVTFEEEKKILLIDGRVDTYGKTFTQAKLLCSQTISYLKSDLGIAPQTSKPYKGKHSDLYFYFGIYNLKKHPKSLPSWLDKNTRISAKIFYETKGKTLPYPSIKCSSELTNTNVSYGK